MKYMIQGYNNKQKYNLAPKLLVKYLVYDLKSNIIPHMKSDTSYRYTSKV